MTTKEQLLRVLWGGEADVTPYTVYSMMPRDLADPRWQRLFEMGLGICHYEYTVQPVEHGVTVENREHSEGGHRWQVSEKVTPVGTVRRVWRDGWRVEDWVKSPHDYVTMQWIVEHTELVPRYEAFEAGERVVGEYGVTLLDCHRTPMMEILVDWAGAEQGALDLAMEVEELFSAYEAARRLFVEKVRLVTQGPGEVVKFIENLSIDMIGPGRYRDYLLPVYREVAPMVEAAGKRLLVHYDGVLSAAKEEIAGAPFHIIESLTEPPEGDMSYAQCREAWPDKVFWANINVGQYSRGEAALREAVIAKREGAGKRGLVFGISEGLPDNWEEAIPVVLRTLAELG